MTSLIVWTIKDLFSSEPFNITHALAEKESSDKDDDASSENDKQQPTESFEDENSKDIYKEDDNDELDKDEDESSKE